MQLSNIEIRKELRRKNCYTFKQLYEFFSMFYNISSRCNDNDIVDEREWLLSKSDIEFRLKSYGSEKIVTDFFAMTWSGGWSYKRKSIHLEWLSYDEVNGRRYEGEYSWYKVDYSKGEYIKVKDFLTEIVNFIIENDEEHYEKPFPLKRELIINKIIN